MKRIVLLVVSTLAAATALQSCKTGEDGSATLDEGLAPAAAAAPAAPAPYGIHYLQILGRTFHADGVPDGRQVLLSMGATFCRADTETECVGNTNRWVWNDMSLGQAYSDPAIQNGGFWIDPNARTLSSKPWENGKALVRINAEVSPGLLWHRRTAEFRAVVDLADYAQSTAEQPKPLELQGTGELAGSTITVTFTPSVAVPQMP